MKIIIGTGFDRKYSCLGEFTALHNMHYAADHGYDFAMYQRRWSNRPPSWDKLLFAQQQLPNCDWFCWIDADAVAVRPIHDLIDNTKFLITGGCRKNRLNFGMWIMRNCNLSFRFLKEVWAQKQFMNHTWWEQRAVFYITACGDPEIRDKNGYYKRLTILPYGDLWCRPDEKVEGARAYHVPGRRPLMERRRMLEEAVKPR